MSIAAEKVAEVMALPERERARLARQLIASLDNAMDADARTQWGHVIDRRSNEVRNGKVACRPVVQVIKEIRKGLNERRQPSRG